MIKAMGNVSQTLISHTSGYTEKDRRAGMTLVPPEQQEVGKT